MSHHELEPERETPDAASMDWVVTELRRPVPVRAIWRAGVLREIASTAAPAVRGQRLVRQWSFRPATAIAAGISCAFVGAALMAVILARTPTTRMPDVLGTLTATVPLPGERSGAPAVRFVFVAPYASRVSLVGDFNGWNPSAMPMRRTRDGRVWLLDVPLSPGRHVYSFVVDGDLAPDPSAPRAGDDDFGVPSSVVLVAGPKA